jgi:hypothetical protein
VNSVAYSSFSIKLRKRLGIALVVCGALLGVLAGLGLAYALINHPSGAGRLEVTSIVALVFGMTVAAIGNWIVYDARQHDLQTRT